MNRTFQPNQYSFLKFWRQCNSHQALALLQNSQFCDQYISRALLLKILSPRNLYPFLHASLTFKLPSFFQYESPKIRGKYQRLLINQSTRARDSVCCTLIPLIFSKLSNQDLIYLKDSGSLSLLFQFSSRAYRLAQIKIPDLPWYNVVTTQAYVQKITLKPTGSSSLLMHHLNNSVYFSSDLENLTTLYQINADLFWSTVSSNLRQIPMPNDPDLVFTQIIQPFCSLFHFISQNKSLFVGPIKPSSKKQYQILSIFFNSIHTHWSHFSSEQQDIICNNLIYFLQSTPQQKDPIQSFFSYYQDKNLRIHLSNFTNILFFYDRFLDLYFNSTTNFSINTLDDINRLLLPELNYFLYKNRGFSNLSSFILHRYEHVLLQKSIVLIPEPPHQSQLIKRL